MWLGCWTVVVRIPGVLSSSTVVSAGKRCWTCCVNSKYLRAKLVTNCVRLLNNCVLNFEVFSFWGTYKDYLSESFLIRFVCRRYVMGACGSLCDHAP